MKRKTKFVWAEYRAVATFGFANEYSIPLGNKFKRNNMYVRVARQIQF